MDEFEIIRRWFRPIGADRPDARIIVGNGDDCAVLGLADEQLCVSVDTLVDGVHVPRDATAELIACRAFLPAVSDLAAMAATPFAFTLALTLPHAQAAWLQEFSRTLAQLAAAQDMTLLGGDLTRGPLTATVQVFGSVPTGQAVRRDGARPGQGIFVTGWPGRARAGLELTRTAATEPTILLDAYRRPTVRIDEALALRPWLKAAIDISDGLAADADHLARASGVALNLRLANLPLCPQLLDMAGTDQATHWALTGGDDYELCLTADPDDEAAMCRALAPLGTPLTRIGEVEHGSGTNLIDRHDRTIETSRHGGWRHFRDDDAG